MQNSEFNNQFTSIDERDIILFRQMKMFLAAQSSPPAPPAGSAAPAPARASDALPSAPVLPAPAVGVSELPVATASYGLKVIENIGCPPHLLEGAYAWFNSQAGQDHLNRPDAIAECAAAKRGFALIGATTCTTRGFWTPESTLIENYMSDQGSQLVRKAFFAVKELASGAGDSFYTIFLSERAIRGSRGEVKFKVNGMISGSSQIRLTSKKRHLATELATKGYSIPMVNVNGMACLKGLGQDQADTFARVLFGDVSHTVSVFFKELSLIRDKAGIALREAGVPSVSVKRYPDDDLCNKWWSIVGHPAITKYVSYIRSRRDVVYNMLLDIFKCMVKVKTLDNSWIKIGSDILNLRRNMSRDGEEAGTYVNEYGTSGQNPKALATVYKQLLNVNINNHVIGHRVRTEDTPHIKLDPVFRQDSESDLISDKQTLYIGGDTFCKVMQTGAEYGSVDIREQVGSLRDNALLTKNINYSDRTVLSDGMLPATVGSMKIFHAIFYENNPTLRGVKLDSDDDEKAAVMTRFQRSVPFLLVPLARGAYLVKAKVVFEGITMPEIRTLFGYLAEHRIMSLSHTDTHNAERYIHALQPNPELTHVHPQMQLVTRVQDVLKIVILICRYAAFGNVHRLAYLACSGLGAAGLHEVGSPMSRISGGHLVGDTAVLTSELNYQQVLPAKVYVRGDKWQAGLPNWDTVPPVVDEAYDDVEGDIMVDEFETATDELVSNPGDEGFPDGEGDNIQQDEF